MRSNQLQERRDELNLQTKLRLFALDNLVSNYCDNHPDIVFKTIPQSERQQSLHSDTPHPSPSSSIKPSGTDRASSLSLEHVTHEQTAITNDPMKNLMGEVLHRTYPTLDLLLQNLYPDKFDLFGFADKKMSGYRTTYDCSMSDARSQRALNGLFAKASFGFNPLTVLSVTLIPVALLAAGMPLYCYIPLAPLIFCYLQLVKVSQSVNANTC